MDNKNKELPEYIGGEKFRVAYISRIVFIVLWSCWCIMMLLNIFSERCGLPDFSITWWFPSIQAFLLLVLAVASLIISRDRLIINNEGVGLSDDIFGKKMYKYFKWEDIKEIGISPSPEEKPKGRRTLYFDTKGEREDRNLDFYTYDKTLINIKFHPKIAHCILNYWEGEIHGLDGIKSWGEYVDELQK